MRIMFVIIVLGIMGIAAFMVYTVRTVTHDPQVWHVDPLEVPPSETPNDFRVAIPAFTRHVVDIEAPIYSADAQTLAKAFDVFVMGQPRVDRVAGSVEEGWITYVQRSERLFFPDYVSVRFYDLDPPAAEPIAEVADTDADAETVVTPPPPPADRATVAIYSRSRFGHGDMGVNGERVRAWMKALESFEQ